MRNVRSNFLALILTLSLSCNCYAGTKTVRFPDEGSVVVSPNGKFRVYSIENESGQTNQVLMLEDTVTKSKWSMYSYNRYIEVLWSPQGDKLMINDYAFSNQSDCVLYDVVKRYSVSIRKIVEQNKNDRQLLSNHHMYLSCSRWITNNRVEVMLSAYGDLNPDGIEKMGEYEFGSNKISLEVLKNTAK